MLPVTGHLPETRAGLKVDPAALEYEDFTYVAASWVEAGDGYSVAAT